MRGAIASLLAVIAGAPALAQPASLPVDVGETVHTFMSRNDLGDVVVTLVDTTPSGLTGAVPGSNHLAPLFWNQGAGINEWTSANLGQVYGVTIDNAANPNIYVTAASTSVIYPFALPSAAVFGPGGPGGVYRLDGTTGTICLVTTLPSDAQSGLGNITFSAAHNSLYVSNLSNGIIYRIPVGQCPLPQTVPLNSYDHGRSGRPAESLAAINDDGLPGLTQLGRRVWGLAVNATENRLYYGVWWDDSSVGANPIESNEVWSVGLDASGNPIAATANLEIKLPDLQPGVSNPAAGLNFSNTGSLLVGERTVGTAHQSRLLEYTGATNAWLPQPVGKWLVGVGNTSCSGAGDSDCAGNVWSAGDGVSFNLSVAYGMMRIPNGGNATHVPPESQSILIDSDQNTGGQDKTQIGTLVHRRECDNPCAELVETSIRPQIGADGTPTGCWIYSFAVHNMSGQTVQYALIPNANVTPNVIFFNPPLANNATSNQVQVVVCNQPPGPFVLPIILMDTRNNECCEFDTDIEIPDCFHMPAAATATCTPAGCNLSITIQPLDFPVGHVFITPLSPTGVTLAPTYQPIAIPQMGTQKLNFTFSGAAVGTQLCVRVFIHSPDLRECCEREVCVTVRGDCPGCGGQTGCDSLDFNNDGLFPDDADLLAYLTMLAGGPCIN
jgi:hypothetical protein